MKTGIKNKYVTIAITMMAGILLVNVAVAQSNVFTVTNPDFTVSPHTGMTKKHWKDAAMYLLKGAFSYVHSLDDPMQFPKQPGKSYPRTPAQVPTEKLEGLCRTLFIAAPLLKDNPSLSLNGIAVADYYRHQIALLVDSNAATFIKHRAINGGPHQNLVEFGALSMSLVIAPEVLWEPLAPATKNALAATMLSYADGPTVPSNWKFFNIFVLSFFKDKGYAVNEKLLLEYLDKSLAHYRGDGWYNDNPAYDYYSMWAFQMYGMLWSEYLGKKYYPAYAKQFIAHFSDLKNTYPNMFSRNGEMIMWGRSISYRIASMIPMPLMGYLNDPSINYGWMRRISSGVMLQFLQHPEFLKDEVPTLGFYGAFEPAVQSYSCRGSVYWMGKAFFALLIPDDNPFWTAKENEGAWENTFKPNQVYNQLQDTAHILVTNYTNIGASEVRAWCHVKAIGANEPFRASENYNRLSYNSAFPWQADSSNGTVAMNYVIKNAKEEWEPLRLFTYQQFKEGMYYRTAVQETHNRTRFQLTDMPLPNGILRADFISTDTMTNIRLGHYALPQMAGKKITETRRKVKGHEVLIIDNGVYQLAWVNVQGWANLEVRQAVGMHPQANNSSVINAAAQIPAGDDGRWLVSLLLWKKSGDDWSDEELLPIRKWTFSRDGSTANMLLKNANAAGQQKITLQR